MSIRNIDPIDLFSMYMQIARTPTLSHDDASEPFLHGKTLGIVNGGAWIIFWSYYFGRLMLPGVKLVNAGNEAVQLSFMKAHHEGRPTPPQSNIDRFVNYSRDLVELWGADAILITCSTMNRSTTAVRRAMKPFGVPVVQIDEAMMEAAVARGGRVLVVATHGPTVANTQALLRETAAAKGLPIEFTGVTVEEAFDLLGAGDIETHNQTIASAIRRELVREDISLVVLAQLSMSVFVLSYPDPEESFGVPVLTSGQAGFEQVRQLFRNGVS